MQRARDTLSRSYASADEQAHAVEVIDVLVPPELKARLLPLLDKMSLDLKLSHLSRYYPQPRLGRTDRLREIISTPAQQYDRWIKACALYAIASLGVSDLELAQQIAAIPHADTADPFLAETASWTLVQLSQSELVQNGDLSNHNLNLRWTGNQLRFGANSNDSSLSTIEKIVILKKIGVFSRIPAGTLIDLAALVTEIRSRAGQLIISKGDAGDCLYIIAGGTVRVHDGTSTINHLGVGDVFGEMALLEPEPRSASVTAIEDTHLLRLDQKPFYQLTEDRIEIVRGIIRVLSHRLRSSVSDLTQLRSQLETSEYQPALLTDTTE
jgi:CRP-like cAMP-binding protein